MKQSELLDLCSDLIKKSQEIVEGQVMPLPVTAWLEKIESLDWSIAETAHHLVIVNSLYDDAVVAAIQAASDRIGPTDAKSTFVGRKMVEMVAPDQKNTPVPPQMVPSANPPADVMEILRNQLANKLLWLQMCSGKDLNTAKVSLPMVPIFKMTLGDCLHLLCLHDYRHALQLKELSEELG